MKLSKTIVIYLASFICLGICIIASLALGSKNIEFNQVINALLNSDNTSFAAVVVRERIPRTIFSIMAGASLGISGALMQSITRNPIADPSILGVNTGASLFVVSGIAFFNIRTANEYIWFALIGAGITAIFVYGIASIGAGGMTPIKLALAGAATSAALSSLVSAVILPRADVMDAYRFWQVGSVSGATWEGINSILPFLIIGLVISIIATPALNALALGDEFATTLGVKINLVRIILILSSVFLIAFATAVTGPIAFVAFLAGPIASKLVGPGAPNVLASGLVGALLVLGADMIGQFVFSTRFPVGVITGILGAPYMLFLLNMHK